MAPRAAFSRGPAGGAAAPSVKLRSFSSHRGLVFGKNMLDAPDNPDLYEFMSGIEYLNLIADLYDIPARQREERVRLYADAFLV